MSRASQELDTLIAEITTDCHDEDDELTAFDNTFDEEAHLPCSATVIGEQVEVLSIGLTNGRRELIATCRRGARRHQIALLGVDIRADPTFSRLLAAYRRWLGTTDGSP